MDLGKRSNINRCRQIPQYINLRRGLGQFPRFSGMHVYASKFGELMIKMTVAFNYLFGRYPRRGLDLQCHLVYLVYPFNIMLKPMKRMDNFRINASANDKS